MQTYPTGYAESHRMAEQIFREILPRHGMAVREDKSRSAMKSLIPYIIRKFPCVKQALALAKRWPTLWPVSCGRCTAPTN